jgi:hypothetical protein
LLLGVTAGWVYSTTKFEVVRRNSENRSYTRQADPLPRLDVNTESDAIREDGARTEVC